MGVITYHYGLARVKHRVAHYVRDFHRRVLQLVPPAEEGINLTQGEATVTQVVTQQFLPDLFHPIVVVLQLVRDTHRDGSVRGVDFVEVLLLLLRRHPFQHTRWGRGEIATTWAALGLFGHKATQKVHVVRRDHQ